MPIWVRDLATPTGQAGIIAAAVGVPHLLTAAWCGPEWPILMVGVVSVAAFGLAAANFWRRGALLIGIVQPWRRDRRT